MTIQHLRACWLVYLATPYSKYKPGIAVAFEHASALAARLVVRGIKVYSPIAHTHPIAIHGGLNPLDHSLWLSFDESLMAVCDALLVGKMKGWEESKGIAHEIKFFRERLKPVVYLDPETLAVSDAP